MSTKTVWSKEEEKAFENAIAKYWVEDDKENSKEEHWEKISSQVPNKDMEELKRHYQMLVDDVFAIEAGNIPLPNYVVEEASSSNKDHNNTNNHGFHGLTGNDKRSTSGLGSGFSSGLANDSSGHGSKGGSKSEQERKKGIPWTEEEHRLFLLGLEKFGKGDWRSISRNFVISRTPTQVASHAQKYFIRLNSMNRDRRRSSIHDITSLNNGDIASSSNNCNNSIRAPPITGQQMNSNNLSNGGAIGGGLPGKQIAHPPHHHMVGLGVYGTPVHPHHHHHVGPSAVGTPVLLPPPGPHHHPPYVVPIAYPLAPPTMHQ